MQECGLASSQLPLVAEHRVIVAPSSETSPARARALTVDPPTHASSADSERVDAGVPNGDVDARRVVVRAHLLDLRERVGGHDDHLLAATLADVPQSRDLDLVAWRQCGGVDDPQFPVDVGPPHPEARGGLVGEDASSVVDGGRQLGDVRDDPGALVS